MPSSASPGSLRLELIASGERPSTWGTATNENLKFIEKGTTGVSNITLTGDKTLTNLNWTADESRAGVLNFSGTLTADADVTLPNIENTYIVRDGTSGGFRITLRAAAGVNPVVEIPPGKTVIVWTNGNNGVFEAGGSVDELTLHDDALAFDVNNEEIFRAYRDVPAQGNVNNTGILVGKTAADRGDTTGVEIGGQGWVDVTQTVGYEVKIHPSRFNTNLMSIDRATGGGYIGFRAGGTLRASLQTSGQSVAIVPVSDRSLKDNIEDLENGSNTIKALQPRTFQWKENGIDDVGFVAQEIQKIIPESVGFVDENLLGVDQMRIIPYLVAALKDALQRIEQLERN